MFFKNLQLYRLPAPWAMTPDQLAQKLGTQSFVPCTSIELQRQGWVAPRGDDRLVHVVNKQMLIQLHTEKKLLPATVINQATKMRAIEIEEQQGFAPGRKQLREIKDNVTDELLPRAFSVDTNTNVWIDPVNGWLVVDAASAAKADDVVKMLFKSIDDLALNTVRTKQSPIACMTDWLASDEVPSDFTADQDTELRATDTSKATVRYSKHTLDPAHIGKHIAEGKQCTRLAMTWADRISFVLTETLTIKQVAPLDVLKENTDSNTKNDDERFDSDFMLMSGELNKLIGAILAALGGEENDQADLVQRAATAQPDSTEHHAQSAQSDHAATPAASADGQSANGEPDELYPDAVKIVRDANRASVSMIQRVLKIGYNHAARLLEQMEHEGIVSAMREDGSRELLQAA